MTSTRLGIVVSEFNHKITEQMSKIAQDYAKEIGKKEGTVSYFTFNIITSMRRATKMGFPAQNFIDIETFLEA